MCQTQKHGDGTAPREPFLHPQCHSWDPSLAYWKAAARSTLQMLPGFGVWLGEVGQWPFQGPGTPSAHSITSCTGRNVKLWNSGPWVTVPQALPRRHHGHLLSFPRGMRKLHGVGVSEWSRYKKTTNSTLRNLLAFFLLLEVMKWDEPPQCLHLTWMVSSSL